MSLIYESCRSRIINFVGAFQSCPIVMSLINESCRSRIINFARAWHDSFIPPKNRVIALWANTRVVKCKYYVSQKQNGCNDKIHLYSILLTFIFKFTARLLWTKMYVLSTLSNCRFTTGQYSKSGIDPFVDGKSAISPFLGGVWHDSFMCVMTHLYVSHVMAHMNQACRIRMIHFAHERVMSNVNESCHPWMSHVTSLMNGSCHIHEWDTTHSCMWHDPWMSRIMSHTRISRVSNEWVMSHLWMSHVFHE